MWLSWNGVGVGVRGEAVWPPGSWSIKVEVLRILGQEILWEVTGELRGWEGSFSRAGQVCAPGLGRTALEGTLIRASGIDQGEVFLSCPFCVCVPRMISACAGWAPALLEVSGMLLLGEKFLLLLVFLRLGLHMIPCPPPHSDARASARHRVPLVV